MSSTSRIENTSSISQHEVQLQSHISTDEIRDTIMSSTSENNHHFIDEDEEDEMGNLRINHEEPSEDASTAEQQPNLEQIQRVYYMKGLEELESLQLFDLSPLANWKLSSYKPGFGLVQLRDDSPDTYWQSDGSNQGNNLQHSITIQFSKKVALERISIFTNYSLDESYTPSKIKIMAGSCDGWDMIDVCTVNFNQPIGWSHIIFNGIRNDGVLKCFMVKLIVLANHQEGKDSHIRAIRCFGKKSVRPGANESNNALLHHDLLKDLSMASGSTSLSGLSINTHTMISCDEKENEEEEHEEHVNSSSVLTNVSQVIGFNTGFQSLELKSISSIR
ncbi:uncharacterized protein SPAPADRAFT_146140 [Spathaspora passalidarum NRRL Y-27907]|uniref:DOC domain-containing protein n=1 Tax=Spathaspora passalidarum (strain NRRL Y-27907 / 11-Y1) TaxID=619300 RepID=G3AG42_SPAPN|nr:uncharacterized protein SPAPADRAFT_146140 [Spathaspora passalidarum NRRL Y-27907]EGW35180.1 hypothetical protein SPAPADRAFT_146140 [Spathaspora passalidarum NRRL Y-27907]